MKYIAIIGVILCQLLTAQTLSEDKLQELNHLSNTYKAEHAALHNDVEKLEFDYQTLYNEQLKLTEALVSTNLKLEEKIETDKKNDMLVWFGIGAAAVLGMVAN